MSPCQILLVDDHPVVREGYAALIGLQPDMCVCGEASSIDEAMALVRECSPDVVIIDISLGDDSGIDLLRLLQRQFPQIKTLMASVYDELVYAERVIRLGARGYVSKRDSPKVILNALSEVLAGRIYVPVHVSQQLLGRLTTDGGATVPGVERLSERELDVLRLLAQMKNSRQIGEAMHLSPKTIESYRERIKRKLGVEDNAELLRFAIEWEREFAS